MLPFGLTNAPATFMHLMQSVFSDYLDKFVIVFLDDILIYSRTEEEHLEHVRLVLERLRQHQLFAKKEKCEFFQKEINFLGHVISENGIGMEKSKIEDIRNWPIPKSADDIRSFLGLTGYYRKFVHRFSHIATPLSNLMRNNIPFKWTPVEQKAFETLKTALITGPILIVPDQNLPFVVTTDASGYAVGATLSQDQGKGLQPIAYISHRMDKAQQNYPVHEQELLAIMHALTEWRHYLEGRHFKIITDHHSLTYLQSQPKLSKRQTRWMEKLAEYDFEIIYAPGKSNIVADALSRRPDHRPENSELLSTISAIRVSPNIHEEIRRAYKNDPDCLKILNQPNGTPYTIEDGLIFLDNGKLRIPNDRSIKSFLLHEAHDADLSGHMGIHKTEELLERQFDWPQLPADVRNYVTSCWSCQINKPSNQKPMGLLQPIPIPTRRWQVITMDFITDLPKTRTQQHDTILVVVDKFSKMVHFIPCTKSIDAPGVSKLFFREIIKHHGVPEVIISDRDPRFISKFWKALWEELGTKIQMSTSYHPQSDGQTERANRTLEDRLRTYVSYHQDDWDEKLTAAEIAVNNSDQSSTGFSPYFLNSGQHPNFPLSSFSNTSKNPAAQEALRRLSETLQSAKENLLRAQENQSKYANRSRRNYEFKKGDSVWLSTKNLNLGERSRKLTAKYTGPFKIIEVISPVAYRLELPPALSRIHNVFHISLLKKVVSDSGEFPNRVQINRPPPEIVQGEEMWEVEKILDQRTVKRGRTSRTEYLIKWKGYPASENSWEYTRDIRAPAALAEYRRQRNIPPARSAE